MLVFGFISAQFLSDNDSALLDLLLMAAVKVILNNWKDTKNASFASWLNWVSNLRGADTISLTNSPWKLPIRHLWDTLDTYFVTHKPP